jgi:hypothetical protein
MECLALEELEDEVWPSVKYPKIMEGHNIGVLQARDSPRLSLEEIFERGSRMRLNVADHLNGNQAIEFSVARAVYHAEAPAALNAQDLKAADSVVFSLPAPGIRLSDELADYLPDLERECFPFSGRVRGIVFGTSYRVPASFTLKAVRYDSFALLFGESSLQ